MYATEESTSLAGTVFRGQHAKDRADPTYIPCPRNWAHPWLIYTILPYCARDNIDSPYLERSPFIHRSFTVHSPFILPELS